MNTTKYTDPTVKRYKHSLFKDIIEYGPFRGWSKYWSDSRVKRLAKKHNVHELDILFAYHCVHMEGRYDLGYEKLLPKNFWKQMSITSSIYIPQINYCSNRFEREFPKELLKIKDKEYLSDKEFEVLQRLY